VNRRLGGALLPLLLLATACTATEPGPVVRTGPPTAFADCGTLTAPPTGSTGPDAAATSPDATSPDAAGTGPPVAGTGPDVAGTDPPVAGTGPDVAGTGPPAASTGPDAAGTGPPAASTGPDAAGTDPPVAGQGRPLPDLTLPCFTGGPDVALGALRGPAVINLWASWCEPCRTELPAFQRLSERAGGKVRVVGVNTRDGRDAAQSIGEDFGLRFPTLFDPYESLRGALARQLLPITLFVDGQGRIRHQDETGALDDAALAALVRRHLGVAVPS